VVKNWDFRRPIFPLVNLPTSLFQNALEGLPPDVYFDWAVLEASQDDSNGEINGRNVPHKAVVNFGYSPMFENSEKIVKAHLEVQYCLFEVTSCYTIKGTHWRIGEVFNYTIIYLSKR
jgi:hypothetical protein